MNELVFKSKDQIVTSSRNIARDFGKGHREVLRAIDNIIKSGSVQDCTNLYHETTYVHEQNKQEYREYLVNKDGFTLLVMGFEGKKAMQFKMQYIQAFNKMEKELTKPMSIEDMIISQAQSVKEIKNDVNMLKNNMRIDGVQEHKLNKLGKQVVMRALGGYKSPAYNQMSGKVFARFWRDFKNHFMLPRYSELPKVQFDEAVEFINLWQPDTTTRIEINSHNRQQRFEVI